MLLGILMLGSILLSFPLPGEQAPAAGNRLLSASEQRSLRSAKNFSSRTKVYLKAAGRRLKAAGNEFERDHIPEMQEELEAYRRILELCERELPQLPQKRSKSFKRHEIKLRKYISNLNDMEGRASYVDRPLVQRAIKISKELRAAFLNSVFGMEISKPPTGREPSHEY